MEVLQNHRRTGRAAAACSRKLSDRLEELGGIRWGGHGRRLGDLGKEPGQLRPPHGAERSEELLVVDQTAPAKRVDPRRERQHLLALVTVAHEHAPARSQRLLAQLCGQPALADAGLADHRDEAGPTRPGGLQRVAESSKLEPAPDEGRLRLWRPGRRQTGPGGAVSAGRPRRRGSWRRRQPPLENLPVERLGLRFRLGAQLARERAHAELVLAERGPAIAELSVQAHQRPMHALLHRIQRHEPQRRLHRRLEGPCVALQRQELPQRFECQFAEPPALGDQPFLEGGLLQRKPLQEIALIERGGPLEGRATAAGRALLELLHVRSDELRIERHVVALDSERTRVAQDPPQREQRLAQPRPGLPLAHVSPQEGRELVAQVVLPAAIAR